MCENGKKCIGVDVGGTSVKIGLFETDGTLRFKWEVPTRKEEGGRYILEDVAASIREVLAEREIHLADILGAGLGIPGPVLPDGYVEVCVNLGWRDLNPQKELSVLLDGIPVKSGNDANVAALGEMWRGGGMGFTDIVMVTLGTGVGGGIIINGQLYTGCNGIAGEIGHMVIRKDGEPCNCGRRGCLEAYCSAASLVRFAERALEDGRKSVLAVHKGQLNAKQICDAVDAGDALAQELFDEYCGNLANGLASFVNLFQPESIVLGGGLAGYGEKLLEPLRMLTFPQTFRGEDRNTEIVCASLGNDAGLVGAAMLVE